jgi:hypothetical protein
MLSINPGESDCISINLCLSVIEREECFQSIFGASDCISNQSLPVRNRAIEMLSINPRSERLNFNQSLPVSNRARGMLSINLRSERLHFQSIFACQESSERNAFNQSAERATDFQSIFAFQESSERLGGCLGMESSSHESFSPNIQSTFSFGNRASERFQSINLLSEQSINLLSERMRFNQSFPIGIERVNAVGA